MQVHIMGNGDTRDDDRGLQCADLAITFNGRPATRRARWHLDAKTDPSGRIQLDGSAPKDLADVWSTAVNDQCSNLTRALGSRSSTGIGLCFGLWHLSVAGCRVDRMFFDPSLRRPPDMRKRQALPQAYHNWLGERRLTMQRRLLGGFQGWHWALLDVGVPAPPEETAKSSSDGWTPSALAMQLEWASKSRSTGMLRELEHVTLSKSADWLAASALNVERYFLLARDEPETPNWWHYDDAASSLIDSLMAKIRRSQEHAFRRLMVQCRR